MLADDCPDASRILAALRSDNPLAEPKISNALAEALVDLEDLAVDLGVTTVREPSRS